MTHRSAVTAPVDGLVTAFTWGQRVTVGGTGSSCILLGMFDAKEQAEAVVLDVEPPGMVSETDMHGVEWEHRKFILEVRPTGQRPFRVETKAKVAAFHHPATGDVITVSFDPKNHKTDMHIDGDPRYDPKLIRKANKERESARRAALLSGGQDPAVLGRSHETADQALSHNAEELARLRHHPLAAPREHAAPPEPAWTVPPVCPVCGARVDQFSAPAAEHPACAYCANPLPRVRVR